MFCLGVRTLLAVRGVPPPLAHPSPQALRCPLSQSSNHLACLRSGCPKSVRCHCGCSVSFKKSSRWLPRPLVDAIPADSLALTPPGRSRTPYLGVLAALVQLGQRQERLRRDVLVEDPEDERRQRGEEEIEEDHLPVIDHGGARETAEELVPEEQVDVALRADSVAS